MPDTPEYVIPEPTQAEVDQIASYINVLDTLGKGVTMSQLRTFYPTLGWGHIQKRLEALVASGRAKSELRLEKGAKVPFEYYSLVEVNS
jgi:uncharacterized protein YqfA (UPF0365 family)